MKAPEQWPPLDPATGEPRTLALQRSYEPDPFQKHAILAIEAGDHVFTTAKTGSGKTFIGEYLIAKCLREGHRVFYTAPIKSLVNEKYKNLKSLFPEATVGIHTGDIKMCPDAQIIIMTAEILRNLFYKRGTATEGVGSTAALSLDRVAGIVMDEVHYIQDPDRGHVWEESLILCPRFVTVEGAVTDKPLQLVLLSATLPSATSLATWIANLHQRRTWLLSTTYRIVPLEHGVLSPSPVPEDHGWVVRPVLDARGKWTDSYDLWLKGKKAIADGAAAHKKAVEARRADGYKAPPPPKVRVEDPVARLLRTVGWLEATKQMPALFFVFSRIKCEQLAALIPGSLVDGATGAGARHIIDFHLSRHKDVLEKSPQYHALRALLIRGIAFHHSGLQPLLKEIVEILFSRGFIKVLFATETFSVGLNMPAKVVVFTSMTKMSDGGRRLLRTDEYTQMAGRAGRRGLDVKGLVLYEPMDEPLSETGLRGLLTGSLPPLESRMRFHYDFILKHLLTEGKLQIAEQSYWAVQQKEARSGLDAQIRLATAAAAAAEKTVTAEDVALVEEYNTMCADVNKKKNAAFHRAREAMTVWIAAHPGIVTKQTKVEAVRIAHKATQQLIKDAADWDAAPLLALGPLETFLEKAGFLEKAAPLGLPKWSLTPLGLLATEVNEGHNLLMPLLATSGRCKDLSGDEIACLLAGFLREGGGQEEGSSIFDVGLRTEVTDILMWIDATARGFEKEEDRLKYFSPTGFWDLSPLWVCVTARWIAGVGLTQLAAEFEMFEGNIQRGLMRIANLLEEWGSLATLRRDLVTLEKLGSLRFLRDEIVVDSLYLRL